MNFQSPTQTLIWHVGLHKTGTTSFQNWLHQMSKDPSTNFSTLELPADAHQMVQSKFDNFEQFLTTVLGSEYLTEIRASADHETWTPSPELYASDIDRVNKLLQKNGHPNLTE